MTRNVRLLASASVLAVAALAASPAFAAGTEAGTTITNTVTLNYQVSGVAQNAVSASDTFTVDRKVNLTVAEEGSATTGVAPGASAAATAFLVTNSSNAPLDFALSASQLAGGTDDFDVSNVRIYLDSDDDGVFEAGSDQLVTHLDQVAADDSIRVFVVADVPLGQATADVAGVRLTATAHEANGAATLGALVSETAGANTSGVDTVLADSDANGNTARDGADFAEDDYTVSAAALTATKTSRIVSDPLNGATDPKMIPGAVVEYCVAIANAAGSATATNVSISDALPAETSFVSGFGILVNGTTTDATCNADGTAGGAHAAGVVTATLDDIAAGVTRTVLFRVTVN